MMLNASSGVALYYIAAAAVSPSTKIISQRLKVKNGNKGNFYDLNRIDFTAVGAFNFSIFELWWYTHPGAAGAVDNLVLVEVPQHVGGLSSPLYVVQLV